MRPDRNATWIGCSTILAFALFVGGAGCMLPSLERPSDSGVDAQGADVGSSSDSVEGPPFSEVKTLLVDNCVGCHNDESEPMTGVTTSNLVFPSPSPSNSQLQSALEAEANKPEGMLMVEPGKPDQSALYVRTQPENGNEMPFGEEWNGDEAESESKLKRWIEEGANIPDAGGSDAGPTDTAKFDTTSSSDPGADTADADSPDTSAN